MNTKKVILLTLTTVIISLLVGTVIGIIIGVRISQRAINESKEKEEITSTVVLERIQNQAFLVTRTIITDQEVKISIDQGSAWSNFWWGHEITAEGMVQVDVGVDLTSLSEEDITVDDTNKTIVINLPSSEIYDSSIKGEIDVITKSGVLYKLLSSDPNEDYNLAMEKLTTQAEDAVNQDEELFDEARSSTLSILQVIFKDTGYSVTE